MRNVTYPEPQKCSQATRRANTFIVVPWVDGTESFCSIKGQVTFGKQSLRYWANQQQGAECKVYPHLLYLSAPLNEAPSSVPLFATQHPHHFFPSCFPTISRERQFKVYRFVVAGHTTQGDRCNNLTPEVFAKYFCEMLFSQEAAMTFAKQYQQSSSNEISSGNKKKKVFSSTLPAAALLSVSPDPSSSSSSSRARPTTLEIIFQTCNSALCAMDSCMNFKEIENMVITSTFIGRFLQALLHEIETAWPHTNTGTVNHDLCSHDLRLNSAHLSSIYYRLRNCRIRVIGYRGFFTQLTNAKIAYVQQEFSKPKASVKASRCEFVLTAPILCPKTSSSVGEKEIISEGFHGDIGCTVYGLSGNATDNVQDDMIITESNTSSNPRMQRIALAGLPSEPFFRVKGRGVYGPWGFRPETD